MNATAAKTNRNTNGSRAPVLVDTEGLQELLSSGRSAALEIGTAAGARVQVGRRVFWNVSKVKQYIDRISE